MTPLAVFIRTLMKTSAIFIGATWIVLHPSLDWSASRTTSVTAEQGQREAELAGLRSALTDQDPTVLTQATWGLGAIGVSSASQALLPLLEDPDAGVRRQAAWAIGAIGREP